MYIQPRVSARESSLIPIPARCTSYTVMQPPHDNGSAATTQTQAPGSLLGGVVLTGKQCSSRLVNTSGVPVSERARERIAANFVFHIVRLFDVRFLFMICLYGDVPFVTVAETVLCGRGWLGAYTCVNIYILYIYKLHIYICVYIERDMHIYLYLQMTIQKKNNKLANKSEITLSDKLAPMHRSQLGSQTVSF